MALGLSRRSMAKDIEWQLITGLDKLETQQARKIAEAVAEAIDKNNKRIAQHLRSAGVSV